MARWTRPAEPQRAASNQAAARSTATSSKRRPAICTPTARPSSIVPAGIEHAGWPDIENGTVNPMCGMAQLESLPHGIGHSAGNAATGATGDSTRSYAVVAATVAARMAMTDW